MVIGRLHVLDTIPRKKNTQHLLHRRLSLSESWWGRVGEEPIYCLCRRSNHCFSACEAVTQSVYIYIFHGVIAATGPGPPHYRGSTITLTQHTQYDEWSARRRDLYLTTQTLTADIHALGRIRTRNPNKRAAADPHLRTRGHFDRHIVSMQFTVSPLLENRSNVDTVVVFYSPCVLPPRT